MTFVKYIIYYCVLKCVCVCVCVYKLQEWKNVALMSSGRGSRRGGDIPSELIRYKWNSVFPVRLVVEYHLHIHIHIYIAIRNMS